MRGLFHDAPCDVRSPFRSAMGGAAVLRTIRARFSVLRAGAHRPVCRHEPTQGKRPSLEIRRLHERQCAEYFLLLRATLGAAA
jgi:hypothetical protein